MSKTEHTPWPARLVLRDTKVIAEEGQRIYTTATGYGYEKREYVCGDIADEMLAALEHARHVMWEYGFSEDELQPIRTAISRATGQAGEG